MGWSLGYDENWKRDIGYGVPSICDHPGCTEEIDRGLSFVCGGDAYGGEHGCGLYFCSAHQHIGGDRRDNARLCTRCYWGQAQPLHPHPGYRGVDRTQGHRPELGGMACGTGGGEAVNHHIIDTAELRRLSGLTQAAALKRWASNQGIPLADGADGPWTTLEAINKALGVSSAANDHAYSPDIV